MAPYGQRGDQFADFYVIDCDRVRTEVADVQQCAVAGYQASRGMRANQVAAADFVGGSFNNRNTVGVEVCDHQLSAVRLQFQIGGSFADVQQGKQLVSLQVNGCDLS